MNTIRGWLGALALVMSLAAAPEVEAAKLKHATVQQGDATVYSATWAVGKARQSVKAPLPNADVQADLKAPLRFPRGAAAEAQAKAVREWAKTGVPKSVKLKVKANKAGGVSFSASAKSRSAAKKALSDAQDVANRELRRFAAEKGFIVDAGNTILPDHAREAVESAPALSALAEALAEGLPADDPRAFAAKALHFAQSIPYEKRKNGGDAGFRRPLSLLVKNKGDCDGKTVLFLGLMRARFPDLPMAVVLVPEHAFAAVALDAKSGEKTLKENGVTYVILEPVGPAQVGIGEPSKAGRKGMRFGRAEIRPVPSSAGQGA